MFTPSYLLKYDFFSMAYDPRQNSLFEFKIHNLNFQLQQLNFTAQFKILHSSFRFHIIGRRVVHLSFGFLTQRLYLTLLAVHF